MKINLNKIYVVLGFIFCFGFTGDVSTANAQLEIPITEGSFSSYVSVEATENNFSISSAVLKSPSFFVNIAIKTPTYGFHELWIHQPLENGEPDWYNHCLYTSWDLIESRADPIYMAISSSTSQYYATTDTCDYSRSGIWIVRGVVEDPLSNYQNELIYFENSKSFSYGDILNSFLIVVMLILIFFGIIINTIQSIRKKNDY